MNDWDADPLQDLPQVGQMFGGKYRLERVLGVGGMGVVVEVIHTGLGEKMAVKFLSGAEARDEERMTRFKREAWAAAKIKSEHVARVSDVAELDDGTTFLVMEYLEGHDLEASLAEGPMPVEIAVDYVLQASEALAEAHKLGIVHRDLKPGNLFLTHRADGSPCVKVLDFGVSKFAQVGAMTQTSELVGSPLYMAPEQILSAKHVDARVDIWALGVILYELIAGHAPFDGETLPVLLKQVLAGNAVPLREAAPDVSAAFDAAVMHCLSVEPAERYADLAELATALEQHGTAAARISTKFIRGVLQAEPTATQPSLGTSIIAGDGAHAGIANDDTVASETGIRACPTVTGDTNTKLGKETAAPVTKAFGPSHKKLGWALGLATVAVLLLGVVLVIWLGTGPESIAESPSAAADTASDSRHAPGSTFAEAMDPPDTPAEPDEPDEPTEPDDPAKTDPSSTSSAAPPIATPTATAAPSATVSTAPSAPATRPPQSSKDDPWNPYDVR